ncbi:MAG: hypothetical protein J6S60_09965 [Oscillospiraceae bacterium]|nr:hypothetical protein [Oscillospiraceae bacterium]
MREIRISNGDMLPLDETCFDDMELLEELISIEKGDCSDLPDVLERIFGAEKKRFYDSLRDEKGRVPISAVMAEIRGIINELGRKNS